MRCLLCGGIRWMASSRHLHPLLLHGIEDIIRLRSAAAYPPASVRVHDLRHTAATLQLHESQDLTAVSATLGHTQTSTTANIYEHAYPAGAKRLQRRWIVSFSAEAHLPCSG